MKKEIYEKIVYSHLRKNLNDFDTFAKHAALYLKRQKQ